MSLHAKITPEDMRELQRAADCAGLEMEFLELRANAARYEWLRDKSTQAHLCSFALLLPGEMDASIDAAMAAKG